MATGRMLRNQISISSQVNNLSFKAAFLFTWIIPHLDDWGRITGDPGKLKALVVPRREEIKIKDIESSLLEMRDQNLIILYSVDGETYIQFVKFEQHQSGLHKRTASKIPPPKKALDSLPGNFPEVPGNSSPTELKRTEENRTETSLLSGKPDDESFFSDQKISKRKKDLDLWKSQAISILAFLNEKTGRSYRSKPITLKPIIARLEDGATVTQCRQIIAKKCREWKNREGMEEYLRPKTLFGATNFEQYVGELVVNFEDGESDVR